jgi:hypothetical protein
MPHFGVYEQLCGKRNSLFGFNRLPHNVLVGFSSRSHPKSPSIPPGRSLSLERSLILSAVTFPQAQARGVGRHGWVSELSIHIASCGYIGYEVACGVFVGACSRATGC